MSPELATASDVTDVLRRVLESVTDKEERRQFTDFERRFKRQAKLTLKRKCADAMATVQRASEETLHAERRAASE